MSNPTSKPEIEILCSTCFAHIAGAVNVPAHLVSHGICQDCLKRDHPGAYFFGRRRALDERLAQATPDAVDQTNRLYFQGGR